MQGHITQVAALAIYGNEFLRGRDVSAFWPAASVFQSCKTVTFMTLSSRGGAANETPYAPDPLRWFDRLRDENVLGLRIHHLGGSDPRLSDRMSVGFVGGGGRWLLEAVKPAVSDYWEARWEIGDRGDPERRIWSITYGRTGTNLAQIKPKLVGEERLRGELKEGLMEITAFADQHQLDGFAKCFRAGLEALVSDDPLAGVYHSDLAPRQAFPVWSEQLLATAQAAWVFGGMGSWNDLCFDGQDWKRYEKLSDRLFTLLNQAVVEGANASFGEHHRR